MLGVAELEMPTADRVFPDASGSQGTSYLSGELMNQRPRRIMQHPRSTTTTSTTSRRALLGGFLGGCAVFLTACGRSSPRVSPDENVFLSSTGASVAKPAAAPPPANAMQPPSGAGAGAAVPIKAPPAEPTVTALPPTATATATATATPSPTATATNTPSPTAIAYNADALTDVLGESITSYAGSIPTRVTNVQRATKLIDGATVAPGAIFSFDQRIGPQTTANGFEVAWGIINNDGTPETVPSIAGGICQVATTLFQAVYWAGLPIVERHHHLYWIAHYGDPPYGQVGLDATVDLPPVDFRFQNTTSNWLHIVGTYDSTHVRFRVFGVSEGWKVTSSKTKITNVVKTDRATVYRDDPTKPVGYKLWIEAAEDGFDATIERLVTKNGKVIDRYDFTNHYDPAHNVLLVGTKGAKPTATPTKPPATATPAPPSPTATPKSVTPTVAAGAIAVPRLTGMPEAKARALVSSLKLQNSATNYQGKGDIPDAARQTVPVGAVLSQIPAPGTKVAPGTTVYIAVRKN